MIEDTSLPWGSVERVIDERVSTARDLDRTRLDWLRSRQKATDYVSRATSAPQPDPSLFSGPSAVGADGERSKRT